MFDKSRLRPGGMLGELNLAPRDLLRTGSCSKLLQVPNLLQCLILHQNIGPDKILEHSRASNRSSNKSRTTLNLFFMLGACGRATQSQFAQSCIFLCLFVFFICENLFVNQFGLFIAIQFLIQCLLHDLGTSDASNCQ